MKMKHLTGKETLISPPESHMLKSGSVLLKPGESVGEHTTDAREEVLVVIKGTATVTIEAESAEVTAPGFIYIPAQKLHNIVNKTESDLLYVYTVTPVTSEKRGCMCGNNGHCSCH